jgi:quinol-cytochrome oxidoreductase complex cytochrome b subunit
MACYAKPPELQWLLGSVVLGAVFFTGFFWYLRRVDVAAN